MQTSVVIPTFNAGPQFARLLEALRAQKPEPPDEIIVIDSGSRDETCGIARAAGARVLNWDKPFNHGLTRDAGISSAGGDIVVLTVQDALPASNDWLAGVSAHFVDTLVAGVSTRQIPPPDGPLELKIKAQFDDCAQPVRISLTDHPNYVKYTPAEKVALYRFDNVCSAIRRSLWEKIPFGECRYAEDLIWARRALEAGRMIVYDPRYPMIHAHRRSFSYEFRRALLDAMVMDEQFGYRYSLLRKVNRVTALMKSSDGARQKSGALKTYFAHGLARIFFGGYRCVLKPLGLGEKLLRRGTTGI